MTTLSSRRNKKSVRGTVLTIMTINTVKIRPLAERGAKPGHLITGFSVKMASLQTTSKTRAEKKKTRLKRCDGGQRRAVKRRKTRQINAPDDRSSAPFHISAITNEHDGLNVILTISWFYLFVCVCV